MPAASKDSGETSQRNAWAVFLVFLRLGLTAFGGPVAHLGYFRDEFVQRRRWLDERSYADLVALCQFLPGPASSQVGLAVGLVRAGYRGALAAWAGFTLPSALLLTLFALGIAWAEALPDGVLQGLKIVAVAVVAQAVWGMARTLCPDAPRIAMALGAASTALLLPFIWGQVGVIVLAGLIGLLLLRPELKGEHAALPIAIGRRSALISLGLFAALLLTLPLLARHTGNQALAMADAFYRVGSLVFGGGHVVLPLLQAEVVPSGWIDNGTFLAGYGAAQAVPGPLFTFAAFLGGSMSAEPSGWLGAGLCLVAIFVPSFLLVIGVLPFWERLRASRHTQAALAGVNAAVVGLLLAALYDPVWTSAIEGVEDFVLALLALAALMLWKLPPWLVVLAGAIGGWLLKALV
ncbi:chromate efflux transporter [Pseudomonas lopnurensis]|uniref:chromate efflux transporter n=1 Tax=Pseudomonas lopnurensis TaxID=1477517 RepID=UPI0018792439|nr:chromate efflux transporter [Pseudomonas lopnurensis]MBE7375577.1 chromate efflux transporter [Pseudomonas lopnurensis]